MRALKVVFKTKGSHKEGMGDITSSLSLAKEFREASHQVFFIVNNNDSVQRLIYDNGFTYNLANSATEIEQYISKLDIDIAILNQLNSPKDEALVFKKCSRMLVTIEDKGDAASLADLRFNILYHSDGAITGFEFMPLDSVFQLKHIKEKIIKKEIRKLMVTQGGSDTHGLTPKIIKALEALPVSIKASVIIGPNFSHQQKLEDVLQSIQRTFELISDKTDLSDIMFESDLAVTAGGNTLFELACVGTPAVVICGEPFEVETAERLQKQDFGINLGFGADVEGNKIYSTVQSLATDYGLRLKMSRMGKELIDGRGTERMFKRVVEEYAKR